MGCFSDDESLSQVTLAHSPLSHPCGSMSFLVCITFNGQGQLCLLTCAEWRDLSNHTRMSTIQSRTLEKKAKNHVTLTWKFPWKSSSTTHLLFLSSYRKNLITFLFKLFPPKWSLLNAQQEKKKMRQEKWKKRGGEKAKGKVKTAVLLLNPKTILKFCFLYIPELCKLIFCIWIRRPSSVRPVNSFVASFSSTVTRKPLK